MKTKLDFSIPLVSRAGDPIKDAGAIAGQLASYLEASRTGPAVKFWGWCKELANGGVLELDDADIKTLRLFADDENNQIPTLVKAQILGVIDPTK